MIAVADTHVVIWYLLANSRLSPAAKQFLDQATVQREKIAVSTISLVEIVYLIEKQRLAPEAFGMMASALRDRERVFEELPLTSDVAEALRTIPRDAVPDMPDRIIAATAVSHGVPLITRDGRIRASNLETIW